MSAEQETDGTDATAAAVKWLTRLGRPVTEESVRNLAPYMSGPKPEKGSPQAKAFAHLVRRGETPTPEAIGKLVEQWQQRDAFFAMLAGDEEPRRVAAFIDSVVRETGDGPLWSEVATGMGWPRGLNTGAMNRLATDGWVEFSTQTRSLRPGSRYRTEPN